MNEQEKVAVVTDFIDHPVEVNTDDVDDLDIDSNMLTVPTIGLGAKVQAASAEFGNKNYTPEAILLAYDARSEMLNSRPVPGVLLSIPNHFFRER